MGPKGSIVGPEGPHHLEKAARRAAIFLVYLNSFVIIEIFVTIEIFVSIEILLLSKVSI